MTYLVIHSTIISRAVTSSRGYPGDGPSHNQGVRRREMHEALEVVLGVDLVGVGASRHAMMGEVGAYGDVRKLEA